jgi:hypothetical protein
MTAVACRWSTISGLPRWQRGVMRYDTWQEGMRLHAEAHDMAQAAVDSPERDEAALAWDQFREEHGLPDLCRSAERDDHDIGY